MISPAPAGKSSVKPSIWAIALGLLTVLFAAGISFAQGMASAPSHFSQWVAAATALYGIALAALGMVAIWVVRLRPLAGKGAISVLLLMLGMAVLDLLLTMTGLNNG